MHVIRPAAPEDLEYLQALETASDSLLAAVLEPAFADLSAPPPADFAASLYILVSGSPPRGFVRIEELDGQAHLEQLSVHPDHARNGLGRALVEAAAEWARSRGFTAMTLCTFADIPFNAPFYASCGFEGLADPGPELAALRIHENEIGLDRLGRRVTMRRNVVGIN